ncbi:unnamed protein product [Tilletia controversa]|uniref:Rieske domain-containing protein n=3 Tax=Tilletia TaxID=13289 RepID=A0A8X7ST09_9BASI|nr:hypothetical protein CF336_g7637 [Tilletia laevis]KAE8186014.1 hypothetical protein CF328_g7368 [Tilletia controversa]KAE8246168.1 hypothetical protein A4X03_0g7312 [Tilletia caries]KAE8239587.1 hypothetical protein A4X06_0g8187 [Tilletia controversa]CAD6896553.1 unnamed protein product [Tilletia controversa]
MLRIAEASALTTPRHHLTLRHGKTAQYHSLLLFTFPSDKDGNGKNKAKFYCMEATCPHLGAPLENASIEDVEDEDEIEDAVIVCPWHEYDFSLRTGESSTGMSTCVYTIEERDGQIWIDPPKPEAGSSDDWEIVELRPISEAFTSREQNVNLTSQMNGLHMEGDAESQQASAQISSEGPQTLSPPDPLPSTVIEWAVLVLNTPEPAKKVHYTRLAVAAFRSGDVKQIGGGRWSTQDQDGIESRSWTRKDAEIPPDKPARQDLNVVRPGQEAKRGKGGTLASRIALLHSLASIEQWAIDLAFDIIARAPQIAAKMHAEGQLDSPKLPMSFYADFMKVALDEAKHFTLLSERLQEMGSYFGALPVHHGLWESAEKTANSLLARISVIHLVHEARGLDANPMTIRKFANAKDEDSVKILNIIHSDECTHVGCGHRWLTWLCAHALPEPTDPVQTFRANVRSNFVGKVKGPFNVDDRARAGLTRDWYDHDLRGESEGSAKIIGVQRAEIPGG